MPNGVSLIIGGVYADQIAGYGELTWSHAADGGCSQAAWNMDLPQTYVSPLFASGTLVQIKAGPSEVWRGVLDEVNPEETWSFSAVGLVELAFGDGAYPAFDNDGNTTTIPDVAIDKAISYGIGWIRSESFSSVPFATTTQTDDLNKLGDLLDAYCEKSNQRWMVGPNGVVSKYSDPTTPQWHVQGGSGRFGLADDDYATHVCVRYVNEAGQYATAFSFGEVKIRPRFALVNRTTDGAMSAASAQQVADSIKAAGAARRAWTNGVEVSRSQITTPGGTPAYLPFVRGGQMVRMFGVVDEQGYPQPYLDWVIGGTSYEAGADTIELTPVGLADRDLASIFAGTAAA